MLNNLCGRKQRFTSTHCLVLVVYNTSTETRKGELCSSSIDDFFFEDIFCRLRKGSEDYPKMLHRTG
jgi:hypothetical protein